MLIEAENWICSLAVSEQRLFAGLVLGDQGYSESQISVYDYTDTTAAKESSLVGHDAAARHLLLEANLLLSGSWDGTVRVWCLEELSCLHVLDVGGPVHSPLIRDGERLLTAINGGSVLIIWDDFFWSDRDLEENVSLGLVGGDVEPRRVSLLDEDQREYDYDAGLVMTGGTIVVYCGVKERLILVDASSLETVQTIQVSGRVNCLLAPRHRLLLGMRESPFLTMLRGSPILRCPTENPRSGYRQSKGTGRQVSDLGSDSGFVLGLSVLVIAMLVCHPQIGGTMTGVPKVFWFLWSFGGGILVFWALYLWRNYGVIGLVESFFD